MNGTHLKDLFVLAADLELANALEGLLSRSRDLGIRDVEFDIERHVNRDSGCRSDAVEYLRPYHGRYRHAMVVFDHHGCGSSLPREDIQRNLEKQLARNGWANGAKVIVIEPEFGSVGLEPFFRGFTGAGMGRSLPCVATMVE